VGVYLAERLGLTRGAINHWANGRRTPSSETIEQLSQELQVRAAWLAFGDGEMVESITLNPPPTPGPGPVKTPAVKAKARRKPATKAPRRKAA
jgi:transcriptional regulator with XRE-family HTH domain